MTPAESPQPDVHELREVVRRHRFGAVMCVLWCVVGVAGGIATSFALNEQNPVVTTAVRMTIVVAIAAPVALWARRKVFQMRREDRA